MSNTKLIVILGISGLQGGSVARTFQSLQGWRIRGITRDPSKASCAPLREAGIELVTGDLNDPVSLNKAFEGANAIFAVTDFWQFMQMPPTFERAAIEGRAPNEVAMDLEVQQGRNIIDVAAKHLGTLDRLVLSTLSDGEKWSKGEIKHNLHFDGKAKYTQYLKDTYPDLAAKSSYLQMGFYLSNWEQFPQFAPKRQKDGTFINYALAVPHGLPVPFVDPSNDTGLFVKALVLNPSAGLTMIGYCEMLTAEQYTAVWAKTLGVEARFESLDFEAAKAGGLPEFLAQEVSESGKYVSIWGWAGGDPAAKRPEDFGVETDKLTRVDEWIKKEDWSSVM